MMFAICAPGLFSSTLKLSKLIDVGVSFGSALTAILNSLVYSNPEVSFALI